ncbi:MAG: aldehyde dehydrogenase family protein [Mycobacterium sp.]|nr:aldehyde dehydrogenase family protein [Mycobacterium sp.]
MRNAEGAGQQVPGSLPERLEHQKRAFISEGPPSAAVRRHRIDRLTALMVDHSDALAQAMRDDFGSRSPAASMLTEIVAISSIIEHTRDRLESWMRPRRPVWVPGLRAEIAPTPKGVVGVIGPWNFPLNLVALPTVEALAAGNRVMIKMSEVTSHTADAFATLVPQYFDRSEIDVVTGDIGVAEEFAALPFDHLFFTGSPQVGTLIARAAAEHLVPVTLELGGKNPAVIAPDANIERSAIRIVRGRMVNGGQACVCPDYVFVPQDRIGQFVSAATRELHTMFPTIVANPDYCSSVNDANYQRVLRLLDDARANGAQITSVVPHGEVLPDHASRKIPPTLVTDVDPKMLLATEEIFGPVLSVMGYRTTDEVVDHVNLHPSPLVAYWYGSDGPDFRDFVRRTRTGGVARNDFALQMSLSQTPFGGVGRSGTGAYHGKAGFDTFSHHRSIVGSDLPFTVTSIAAPPFTRSSFLLARFSILSTRRRARQRIRDFEKRSANV